MSEPHNIHMFVKFNDDEINQLKQIAQQRYGKASVSLLAKKLLQEQIRQPENLIEINQEENIENQRITLRLPPTQYTYLAHKAELQHSSLNDTVRDIIAEYITKNPTLSNAEVQAIYQSNTQLLRIGRNLNQIAKQLNNFEPTSLTSQHIANLHQYIQNHTGKVGKIIGRFNQTRQGKIP
ncbi:plasmid mobilization relaxosome protein MobC [Kingella kingae]|uniref:plasmid mobilization relaxosome protein MobC n=1 Tax=Kingella kingae TaxID=504 RepID=UPI00254C1FD8|nr:plasmid mobilization relaxosome protein MobC [Kingella kingae]MDK4563719.1 plasmid mobilization relaxosome protein MobC [Kingella kingae]MDK4578346.1 plasmid mobilization relaxosome protein MobC [Kingella kingae]MDK4608394.1 plasmid mobilization relaxosome protein MobC [Kingella kingae]MDK4625722.1 plasmid mobilization relaxosome protein MobC [Kingella kingae]MDK4673568.1 plasmid mobilization relaxosome protein MobC [Kingella kingae]